MNCPVKPDVDNIESYDKLPNSKFYVNSQGNLTAQVLKRAKTAKRDLIGKHYSNHPYIICDFDYTLNDGTV
jgi:hypothetical protein